MDQDVLDFVVAHRTTWLTDVFTVVTTVGNTMGVAVATLMVAVVLATRRERRATDTRDAGILVVGMLAGFALMNTLKYGFARERPPVPERLVDIDTYSFPSGHAMMSAMLAALLIGVLARRSGHPALVAAALTAASVLIGLSRIYLGAHWTTDVLAGWIFGALWGWLVLRGRLVLRDRSRRLRPAPAEHPDRRAGRSGAGA